MPFRAQNSDQEDGALFGRLRHRAEQRLGATEGVLIVLIVLILVFFVVVLVVVLV
jgi:hypothetical protein